MPLTVTTLASKFVHQNARYRLFWALAVALCTFLALGGHAPPVLAVVATWDAFALAFLLMAAAAIAHATPRDVERNANVQDSGRHLVFVFALIATFASLFAVVLLLHSAKGLKGEMLALHLGLAVLAVASSWLLVHTLFAFRYAHMYYSDTDEDMEGVQLRGGLDFPGDSEADYWDFVYFSFVIGMTFQVSDVEITERAFRHQVLVHSMLAFAFSTMILALGVNIVSGLIS